LKGKEKFNFKYIYSSAIDLKHARIKKHPADLKSTALSNKCQSDFISSVTTKDSFICVNHNCYWLIGL